MDEHETVRIHRQVVAVVVTWRGRVGLFKRGRSVHHDAGAWHCITGYLEPERSPLHQAVQELWEETGLAVRDLQQLTSGPILRLPDPRGGQAWTVHTFKAVTNRRRLTLNWELRPSAGFGHPRSRGSTARSPGSRRF